MTSKSLSLRRFVLALGIASVAATVHGAWFVTPDAAEAPAALARVRVSVWDGYEQEWKSHYLVGGQTFKGAESDIIELRPEAAGASVAALPSFIEPFSLGSIPAPAPVNPLLDAQGTPVYGRLKLSQPVLAGGPNVGQPSVAVGTPDEFDVHATDTNGSVGMNLTTLNVGGDAITFTWDVTRWAKGDVFLGLNGSAFKVVDRDGAFKRYIATSDYGLVDANDNEIGQATTGCAANWQTGEVFMTNFGELDPAVNVTGRHPGTGSMPYALDSRRLSTAIFRSDDASVAPGLRYPIDGYPESVVFDNNQNMYVGNSLAHFGSDGEHTMDANYHALEDGGWMVDEVGDPIMARRMNSSDGYAAQRWGDVSTRLKTDNTGALIFSPHTFTWGSAPDETVTLDLPDAFWEDAFTTDWLETEKNPGQPWPFRWPLGKRLHKYTNTNPTPGDIPTFSATDREIFWTFTSRQGTDWIDLAADQRTMYYTSENPFIHRYDTVTGMQLPDLGGGPIGSPMQRFGTVRILPPGDGSGGFIVAAVKEILRLNEAGDVIQTYNVGGDPDVVLYSDRILGDPLDWYALEVDPGGRTFWASSRDTGYVYHFDIATGAVIQKIKVVDFLPEGDENFPSGRRIEGMCIMWEYTAAQEECGDGIDNDGDGFIDESCQAIESCSVLSPGDDDADGFVDHNDPDCGEERPPMAFGDAYTTNQGTPLVIPASGVVSNDTDPDNVDGDPYNDDPLIVSTVGTNVGTLSAANVGVAVTTAQGGTAVLAENGSLMYTPAAGFHGLDTFMYQTADGAATSNEAVVSITVRPLVADDSYTVNQGGTITVTGLSVSPAGMLVNDSSAPMSISAAGAGPGVLPIGPGAIITTHRGGQVFVSANGTLVYTPLVAFVGVDSFVYRGNDGTSDSSNLATVTITVADVNELIAVNDAFSTPYFTPFAANVHVNDVDPEGHPFVVTHVNGQPIAVGQTVNIVHGTVTRNPSGSLTVSPDLLYFGLVTFEYTIQDNPPAPMQPLTSTARVDVTVGAPAILGIADSYTTAQNTALTVNPTGVLANDIAASGRVVHSAGLAPGLTLSNGAAVTFATLQGGVATLQPSGAFTYTPATNFVGIDTFNYRLTDGLGVPSNVAAVNITVTPTSGTSVSTTPNPSVYGSVVPITARVTCGANQTPTGGTVTFKRGSTVIATLVPVINGVATVNLPASLAAGTYAISADYSGVLLLCPASSGARSHTVNKAPLTVTANNRSKVYGSAVTFAGTEFTTSGLLLSDTVTSATITSSGGAPATATVAGSPYTITPSAAVGSGLSNYTITFVTGTLTVTPKALTITASNLSKPYGTTATFAGTEFTTAGLVNGDTVTSVSLSSTGAPAATPVGPTHPIVPSAAVGTGLGNYDVAYTNGTLTVSPKVLTVTATNLSKPYGTVATFAGTEFTVTGLNSGDSVSSVSLTSTGAPAAATVAGGPYPVVPSAAVGTGLANYTVNYANGNLTVTPALLTVTALPQSKVYGTTFTFTGTPFTTTGLLLSDTVTSVTTTSGGTPATATVAGSPYAITPSAAVGSGLGNYTITYATGPMTVTPKALTITAANRSKVYGTVATFAGTEFTATGLVNGDTVTGATLASTGAPALADVNTYAITIGQATGSGVGNYSIGYADGSLTVTPAALTVTATNLSKVEGDPNPVLTGTGTGVVAGDNITWTYSTTANQTSPAGSYPIVPALVDPNNRLSNYTVTLNSGTLTVSGVTTCSATGFLTYSQGGWGAKPSGNNPGQFLATHFASVYPGGSVTIGGTKTLTFTSATAIQNFLPQGGTPAVLTSSATNPTSSTAGNFAAQVLALRLAVDFSAAGKTKVGLGGLVMVSGPFAGQTLNAVLALANAALGGQTTGLPSGMTISTLNGIVESLNLNFHEGTVNNGLLKCASAGDPPCAATTIAFTGNSSTYGAAGNIRSFSSGGIAVKASAFSRSKSGSAWATAYLGVWSAGLGVTDGSEGSGENDTHKVDNGGDRLNYVLFEFSQPVVLTQAYLDSIGADSDATVWLGTKTNPYTNHLTLSDSLLTSLGTAQESAGSTSARWATFNGSLVSGNVLVIAAKTADSNDAFKVSKLTIACSSAPVNRLPDAVHDARTTQGTTPVAIPVLANDTDPDGDTLTVVTTGYTQPANGTVTLSGGVFTFVASAGFTGTTTFTYTISDGKGGSDSATVTITVQPNEVCYVGAQSSQIGAEQTWWMNSNGSITIRTTLSRNFVDNTYGTNKIGWPNGHTLSDLKYSDFAQVALYDNAGVKKLEMKLDYLSYTNGQFKTLGVSSDGDGGMVSGSSSSVVSVMTSLDRNFNQYGYQLTSNSPATTSSYATNASYPNWIWDVYYDVTVTSATFGSSGFGYPRVVKAHASPSKTARTEETFSVTSCDDAGEPPVNEAPVAVNNAFTTPKATALVVGGTGLLGNDSDPDEDDLTVVKVNGSTSSVGQSIRLAHGYVKVNANGTFTYTPDSSYVGTETFTYQISDGAITSAAATVTITVSSHQDGDDCDHDRGRGNHEHGDNCDHDRACDNDDDRDGHHRGDGCDHDRNRSGHRSGDNCDHDRDEHRSDDHDHGSGDRCDHDRNRNGHRDGDNCDHDRGRSNNWRR